MSGPLDHVQLHLVENLEDANAFTRWLGERREGPLGVDTESGGLLPHRDRLRLIQFGDAYQGWAIPADGWGGLAREAYRKYEGPLVEHNSPYDSRVLWLNGFGSTPWSRLDDTMTMQHLVDPTVAKGLKATASRLIDRRASAEQKTLDKAFKENGWTWDTVPVDFPPYWMYSALDPVLTARLHPELRSRMDEETSQAYDLERAVLRVVANMMLKGMRVDPTYCRDRQRQLLDWAEEARQWLHRKYGVRNAGSNQQIIQAFTELGVELLDKQTASGAQAADKEVLEATDHELAGTVLKIRHAEKMAGTYFGNMLDLRDGDDVLHPSLWPCGARSGRFSCSDPNLQNIPRKDPVIRSGFIPREGHKFITCDADQIEMRLMAWFSGDPNLQAAFSGGGDFFTTLAREVYNDPNLEKGDPRRQPVKNYAYASIFGAGVPTMAKTAGIGEDEMQAISDRFHAKYPGVRRFMNGLTERVKAGETVHTPNGRVLSVDDNRGYSATNIMIQGHAAEVMKRGLLDLDSAGLGEYLALTVHDEVVLDVPKDEVEEVARLTEKTLTDNSYDPTLTWSADVVPDWGYNYRE